MIANDNELGRLGLPNQLRRRESLACSFLQGVNLILTCKKLWTQRVADGEKRLVPDPGIPLRQREGLSPDFFSSVELAQSLS
jgi:hypothetical protein